MLRRLGPARLGQAHGLLDHHEAARQLLPTLERKVGRILANGLRHELAPRDAMKEAMEDAGRAVAHHLEKYLTALGTIATVAPLLGLFGTVIGMIEIFGAQDGSGARPEQLAHGVSVALYNTAFGLMIAIPALIAYRYFRGRVDDYLVDMEQQALRLMDLVRGGRR